MDTHSFVYFWTPSLQASASASFDSTIFKSSSFYNSILLTNDYYNGTILFLDVCLD